jgi:hypothetical protein
VNDILCKIEVDCCSPTINNNEEGNNNTCEKIDVGPGFVESLPDLKITPEESEQSLTRYELQERLKQRFILVDGDGTSRSKPEETSKAYHEIQQALAQKWGNQND